VHAAFAARSYRAGDVAALRIFSSPVRALGLDLFPAAVLHDRHLERADVQPGRQIRLRGRGPWTVYLRLGHWQSGLYFARLSAPRGAVGFAPIVIRPLFLGAHRTLVVEPTNTWQAYNTYAGDSWYLDNDIWKIDLGRPYAGAGLPPHFESYDLGFLRWFAANHAAADFVSDDDLGKVEDGSQLRRLYHLIVFPGHEEYVTGHVFDVVEGFRNRGGSLAFLSANNFFYEVKRQGSTMKGRSRWDKLGRPEAALVGAAYRGWESHLYANHPYVVTGADRLPWLFAGTGLENGLAFGSYGIEIDQRTKDSPRGTIVAARIANVFGRGHSAEMTYYRRGQAQVFDAGVMNFGGGVSAWPAAGVMLHNLWNRLGGDWSASAGRGEGALLRREGHLGDAAVAVGLLGDRDRSDRALVG
jgi:N,N-dimethylformamidase beta subunit-like, C-terminal